MIGVPACYKNLTPLCACYGQASIPTPPRANEVERYLNLYQLGRYPPPGETVLYLANVLIGTCLLPVLIKFIIIYLSLL